MLSAECYAGERCHPEPLGLGTESSRTHTFFLHSAVNVRSTTRQALQENGDPSSKHSQVRTLPRFIFYTKETDKKQIHVSDDENCWARGGCKDAEVSRARRGRVHDTDLCVEGPRPGACLRIQSMAKKQCKECRGGKQDDEAGLQGLRRTPHTAGLCQPYTQHCAWLCRHESAGAAPPSDTRGKAPGWGRHLLPELLCSALGFPKGSENFSWCVFTDSYLLTSQECVFVGNLFVQLPT